jgi:hypothetical protein
VRATVVTRLRVPAFEMVLLPFLLTRGGRAAIDRSLPIVAIDRSIDRGSSTSSARCPRPACT